MKSEFEKFNFSEKQRLFSILGAFIFIVPTFLSISGVTIIGICSFSLFIILNGKIHTKLSIFEICLPFIFVFTYLNLYLLKDLNHHSLYKALMIDSTFLLSVLISTSMSRIDLFLKYSAVIISFCGFIVLLGLFYSGFNLSINNRLSFGLVNPIWLGRFAGMAILILYNQKGMSFSKPFYLINFLVIFLSGSKGPIIGLLVVGIFHYLKSVKYILLILIAVLLLFFSFNYFNEELRLFITSRFLSLNPNATELLQEIEDDRISIIMRSTTNYVKSVDIVSFFWGLGPNQSSFYYYNSILNERWYPHNIFLELFFEYGCIAILIFITILIKAHIWKSSLLNSLILFFLINALFSGDLPLNWLLFLFISIKYIR